ncbi:Hypothetical_protein [Hexamita inflata]|uniref:Hypothetical_protein n=1 Tax=Hexamita inflata TaxID=28002 RepID=A0AA86TH75_9EUKA|nr:Hypothetical protein HINF_LOCUS5130 [Hexamita inflata]
MIFLNPSKGQSIISSRRDSHSPSTIISASRVNLTLVSLSKTKSLSTLDFLLKPNIRFQDTSTIKASQFYPIHVLIYQQIQNSSQPHRVLLQLKQLQSVEYTRFKSSQTQYQYHPLKYSQLHLYNLAQQPHLFEHLIILKAQIPKIDFQLRLSQTFHNYVGPCLSGSSRFQLGLNKLISVFSKKLKVLMVPLKQLKLLLNLFQQVRWCQQFVDVSFPSCIHIIVGLNQKCSRKLDLPTTFSKYFFVFHCNSNMSILVLLIWLLNSKFEVVSAFELYQHGFVG